MNQFNTIQDIVLKARDILAPQLWDFIVGGSESETTLLRNRLAIDTLALRPRVLRDVSKVNTSASFLGNTWRLPLFLAPIGALNTIHPQAAQMSLHAANRFGIPDFLSSVNGCVDIEEASDLAQNNLFFQLYIRGDDSWLHDYLDRIKHAKPRAFCLCVDIPLYGRRERDLRNRYHPPGREKGSREGFHYQSFLTWDFVEKLKHKLNDIPLIIKGISTAEDAQLAVNYGVDVIYVSNHGGRQLDHGRATIDVLPEIVSAVNNKAEIIIDSGFMRGTDMLKAVALGAKAIGIGKLKVLALAVGGDESLTRALEILEDELRTNMGLLGVTSLQQLSPEFLKSERSIRHPNEFTMLPVRNLQ